MIIAINLLYNNYLGIDVKSNKNILVLTIRLASICSSSA